MLDDMFWSILANLLYNGMTWATAKAYMLQNYVLQDSASQTAAAAAMEANKTGGANIVAQGAIAPGSRTQTAAPWYVQGAPYEASLPNTAGILPSISGAAGDTLGTDGVTLAWGSGGSGIASFGAVGSAPSANGATVAGSVATLQPADATHPGLMTAIAQSLAGAKTFTGGLLSDIGLKAVTTGQSNFKLGSVGGYAGLWLGANADGTPAIGAASLYDVTGTVILNMASSANSILFAVAGVQLANISGASGDLTLGYGNAIVSAHGKGLTVTSPDGLTTKTITINNAGAITLI